MALKRRQKVAYGIGRFGSTLLLNVVSLATFYIYLTRYSLDPVLNGIANGLGKVSIAVSGVVMGYISDATVHPRLGKRKPYIISGSILLAVSFFFLFFPELLVGAGNQMVLFAYEAFFLSAFNFFYGYLLTPYQAWLPEITEPFERSEVSGYENIFNILGNMVGIGATFAIPMIIDNRALLMEVLAAFCVIEVVLYLIPSALLMEPEEYKPIPKLSWQEVRIVLTDRNFDYWMLAQGTLSMGLVIVTTLLLNFIESLGLVSTRYIGTALGLMLIILGAFVFWIFYTKRTSVKKSMTYAILVMGIFLPLVSLRVVLPPEVAVPFVIAMLAGAAVGIAGYWLLVYIVQANIIEMNFRATGVSRAGAYIGLNGLVLNAFQAIGYYLTGHIAAFDTGFVYWTLIAGAFVLAGAVIFQKVQPDIE